MKFFRLIMALSICGALSFSVAPLQAQNPVLPTLEVTPSVVPESGVVTLRLPPGVTLPANRVELAIYEWNHAQPAAEVWRVMELRDGRWQTNVTISADPGFYEFRLLTTDKTARPLTAKNDNYQLTVPGVARVAGAWLPDGLPFAFLPKTGAVSAPNAPLFVPDLQRDLGRKPQAPQSISAFPGGTPAWRTLPLPPLRDMLATGYDWATLKSDLAKRVTEARNRGERALWGWSLSPGQGTAPLSGASNAISQLRGVLNEISPGAALIYEVDATQKAAQAARDIDGAAAFCDAVLLRVPDNDSAFWALKTARRVAEEQPLYDLPIWVRVNTNAAPPSRETLRTYWMAGATGFIFDETELSAEVRQFRDEIARDASLWIGAVTLEDTGVLPVPDAPDAIDDEALLNFVQQLRGIGRIPLLARANPTGAPESFMLRLGNRISAATIERLEKLARAGAKVYIEGTPTADETGKATSWRLTTLVGADVTAMPTRRTNMVLDDIWVFGIGRGTRVPVEQSFSVQLKAPSMAKQAGVKKGVLTEVGPRVVATLEDGSPGVVINSLGKGEVIWMPHRLTMGDAPTVTSQNGVPTATAPGAISNAPRDAWRPWQKYLHGMADYVAPRLVQQRALEGAKTPLTVASVAMRRSPKGTLLLWLNRKENVASPLEIVTEGASEAVLELNDLKAITTTRRGFQTTFKIETPSDALLALSPTKQALDAERDAPRAKAKLR